MVELAATLFVIIVALNVIAIFVRGVGGWGNAGLVIFLTLVAIVTFLAFLGVIMTGGNANSWIILLVVGGVTWWMIKSNRQAPGS